MLPWTFLLQSFPGMRSFYASIFLPEDNRETYCKPIKALLLLVMTSGEHALVTGSSITAEA